MITPQQQRILEINRLLNQAEDLGLATPGLQAELETLEGPVTVDLPEGAESPLEEHSRIRHRRDEVPFYRMLA